MRYLQTNFLSFLAVAVKSILSANKQGKLFSKVFKIFFFFKNGLKSGVCLFIEGYMWCWLFFTKHVNNLTLHLSEMVNSSRLPTAGGWNYPL